MRIIPESCVIYEAQPRLKAQNIAENGKISFGPKANKKVG